MDLMAIDLGTASVKITITDSDSGKILATGKQGYCLNTPKHGWIESDPTFWWTATILAIKECLGEYQETSNNIAAIALSGQMHGIIPVDKKNRELYNCIMYSDSRSDEILYKFPDDLRARLESGGYNPLTSMMSAPKLLWLSLHEKEIWRETYKWVFPKDYIRMKLTGEICTDVSDASGSSMMDYATLQWMDEVEKIGLPIAKFPDIKKSHEVVSTISKQTEMLTGIMAGTPVVCGGADMACTALGTGAIDNGLASVTIGSAGHVIVPMDNVDSKNINRFYQMCHAIPDKYYAFGPIISGGICLSWLRDMFMEVSDNLTFSQLDVLADKAEKGSSGIFFLPYMAGTVIPHSDPRARGAFVGLSLNSQVGDVVRSIMEGVGYACKEIMNVMDQSGITVNNCNIGEGGSRSPLWCAIIASAFNVKEYGIMKNKDSAPVGATVLAGMGIGAYKDWNEAINKLTKVETRKMDNQLSEYYAKQYDIYKEIYPALKHIFVNINKQTNGSAS